MDKSAVTGLSEFRQQLNAGFLRQREEIKQKLNQLGIQMTVEIKAGAPIRSGATVASVRYRVLDTANGEALEIKVGDATAFYVPHVEFGTAEAPAHPFVRPVVYSHEKHIPVRIEEGVNKAWE